MNTLFANVRLDYLLPRAELNEGAESLNVRELLNGSVELQRTNDDDGSGEGKETSKCRCRKEGGGYVKE
ncbi:hypothetical protein QVD17_06240 [Tagetes erecta]|uniref:Uncharacterized protein n=1 Tax=Tagetes erecta TaxID=13708 RepID=A0AAD8LFN6_TARER|nr:hypothetical protein QVD17_06240 [Tagetes erecta]